MPQTPEGKVKDKIKLLLKEFGIWYYMPVQTGWGVTGIPDFVCCWEGRFLGIEAKAPGKRTNCSPHQLRQRDEIVKAGGLWVVVDDAELLKYWLIKRQHFKRLPEALQDEIEKP